MAYQRVLALAEVAVIPKENKKFYDFKHRLQYKPEIRYTPDESEPTNHSELYVNPFYVSEKREIKSVNIAENHGGILEFSCREKRVLRNFGLYSSRKPGRKNKP